MCHFFRIQTLFLVLLVQNTLEKYFFVLGSFEGPRLLAVGL